MIPFDDRDLDAVVRTLVGEARGEPVEGQIAVAWVIMNRVMRHWRNKKSFYDVCHDRMQFSCWNENDPNSAKIAALATDDPTYRRLQKIAQAVIAHEFAIPDPTGGATMYKVRGTKASWDHAVADQKPKEIGHHDFFFLAA